MALAHLVSLGRMAILSCLPDCDPRSETRTSGSSFDLGNCCCGSDLSGPVCVGPCSIPDRSVLPFADASMGDACGCLSVPAAAFAQTTFQFTRLGRHRVSVRRRAALDPETSLAGVAHGSAGPWNRDRYLCKRHSGTASKQGGSASREMVVLGLSLAL